MCAGPVLSRRNPHYFFKYLYIIAQALKTVLESGIGNTVFPVFQHRERLLYPEGVYIFCERTSELLFEIPAEIFRREMHGGRDIIQKDFFLVMFLDIGKDIFDLCNLLPGYFGGAFRFRYKEIVFIHCHDHGKESQFCLKLITGAAAFIQRKHIFQSTAEGGKGNFRLFQFFRKLYFVFSGAEQPCYGDLLQE